jgi:alkylation response protein AidB-like acyl-CoA dehydrogenase
MTTVAERAYVLSDEIVDRCGGRAAEYDRENRFFNEDFEELKQAGYLKLPIPREFGGRGRCVAPVDAGRGRNRRGLRGRAWRAWQ